MNMTENMAVPLSFIQSCVNIFSPSDVSSELKPKDLL